MSGYFALGFSNFVHSKINSAVTESFAVKFLEKLKVNS